MYRCWTGLFVVRGLRPLRALGFFKRLGWGAAALALVGALLVVGSSAVAAGGSDLGASGRREGPRASVRRAGAAAAEVCEQERRGIAVN